LERFGFPPVGNLAHSSLNLFYGHRGQSSATVAAGQQATGDIINLTLGPRGNNISAFE
jgi:hypothetical protein